MTRCTETAHYDGADYLTTPEDIAGYLAAALEDGDPAVIRRAQDVIARAELKQARHTAGERDAPSGHR